MAPAPGGGCDATAGAAHPGCVRLPWRSGGSSPALWGLGFAAAALQRADRCSPRLGDLALLTQKTPADAIFELPDRLLELTEEKEIIIKFRSHELEALFLESTVYNRSVAMYQSAADVNEARNAL